MTPFPLDACLRYLFPDAQSGDWFLLDEGDGPQVRVWNRPEPQPDQQALDAVLPLALACAVKAEQMAALLAPTGQTRLTVQLSIELAETIARLKAPAYGLTEEQAIAYAYSKNKSYRQCKDLEAALRALETS